MRIDRIVGARGSVRALPAAIGLAALLGVVAPALAGEQVAGIVVGIEGQGFRLGASGRDWIPLGLRKTVFLGDRLETLPASKLQLVLQGDTLFVLGPESHMQLPAPPRGPGNRLWRVTYGFFRMLAAERSRRAQLLVHLPTAVAAVRGTEIVGEAYPTKSAIAVLSGEVEVRGLFGRKGVRLGPGQGTDVSSGEAPSRPVTWGQARLQRLQDATHIPLRR
jgi:ferric-dicitrate binding protein FerR (iron transport regulator)